MIIETTIALGSTNGFGNVSVGNDQISDFGRQSQFWDVVPEVFSQVHAISLIMGMCF